jgi:hypothetical protein
MVQAKLNNSDWVRETRSRLSSLGWFMKCLKEPLARLAKKSSKGQAQYIAFVFRFGKICRPKRLFLDGDLP